MWPPRKAGADLKRRAVIKGHIPLRRSFFHVASLLSTRSDHKLSYFSLLTPPGRDRKLPRGGVCGIYPMNFRVARLQPAPVCAHSWHSAAYVWIVLCTTRLLSTFDAAAKKPLPLVLVGVGRKKWGSHVQRGEESRQGIGEGKIAREEMDQGLSRGGKEGEHLEGFHATSNFSPPKKNVLRLD